MKFHWKCEFYANEKPETDKNIKGIKIESHKRAGGNYSPTPGQFLPETSEWVSGKGRCVSFRVNST
jgi:hypothetical protein